MVYYLIWIIGELAKTKLEDEKYEEALKLSQEGDYT